MPLRWLESASRLFYGTLLRALVPLYLLRLRGRGRAEPVYRLAFGERLGLYVDAPSAGWIWLHAVSLGETRAAEPLIAALRAALPDMRLLLTHGTATGREAGVALLREGDAQVWLPLDTPGATRRFLKHFSPRVGLLMETEVWPNLMAAAARTGVPVLLVNARLSDRSLRRGQRLAWLMRPAARALRGALAQTPEDARRLREMGVARVDVMGNLKYDMRPDEARMDLGRRWRAASPRPIVMAASTREGEEQGLLDTWREALAAFEPDDPARPRLLLVPRHPQRFDAVAQMIGAAGLSLSRRSTWTAGSDSHGEPNEHNAAEEPNATEEHNAADEPDAAACAADVWLGDSLGEMAAYYAAAALALLGGSFAPLGGQNLIEAAACGCPVIMGPHTFNFAQAAHRAEQAGAALRVDDIDAGVKAAVRLIGDAPALSAMSRQALEVAGRDRGAAQRALRAILGVM